MVKQIKENMEHVVTDSTKVIKNTLRLIESAALLIVAVYAIYGAYHYEMSQGLKYVLIVAGVVIGLRGSYELLRHLAEKDRN